MIHALTGVVQSSSKQSIMFHVEPALLEISVPREMLFPIAQKQQIYVHLHWNQEQGPSLYGFQKEREKTVFLLIIGCSGLGPRIGLAVLADLGTEAFLHAIQTGDEKLLSKVNGIGIKKAEQMIVQLKHKVHALGAATVGAGEGSDYTQWNTVMEALTALHYSRSEIAHAVDFVRSNHQGSLSFDQIMRYALSFLAKQ